MTNKKKIIKKYICNQCGAISDSEITCCGRMTNQIKDEDNANWPESYKCMICGAPSERPITCCGQLADRVD